MTNAEYSDRDKAYRCPICRSEELEFGEFAVYGNDVSQETYCTDCYAQWESVYTLCGYAELKPNKEQE